MKKITTLILITLCAWLSVANAEISPEKRKEIEKMLKLTGMEKLSGQLAGQMISTLKKQTPEIPEVFWTKFQDKLDTRQLIESIIPVYDKYYTIDDLKAVNTFYESPAGQKVLATLPQVMQEAMKIGQDWGAKIAKEALAEIEQEKKKTKNLQ